MPHSHSPFLCIKKCPSHVWSVLKMHKHLGYAPPLSVGLGPLSPPVKFKAGKGQCPRRGAAHQAGKAHRHQGFRAVRDLTPIVTAIIVQGFTSAPLLKSFPQLVIRALEGWGYQCPIYRQENEGMASDSIKAPSNQWQSQDPNPGLSQSTASVLSP